MLTAILRALRPPPPATLILLHIPKTGGTSLSRVLRDAVRPHQAIRLDNPVEAARRLGSIPEAERRRLGLLEGHFYYGLHRLLPGPSRYVTVLRDPVERVSSFYHFVREKAWHHLHERVRGLTLAQCYERRVSVELDNFMTRALTDVSYAGTPFGAVTGDMFDLASANLASCAMVATTERLDEAVALAPSCLGMALPPVPHENRGPREGHAAELSSAERDVILAHNRFDARLLAHAHRILTRRLERHAAGTIGACPN